MREYYYINTAKQQCVYRMSDSVDLLPSSCSHPNNALLCPPLQCRQLYMYRKVTCAPFQMTHTFVQGPVAGFPVSASFVEAARRRAFVAATTTDKCILYGHTLQFLAQEYRIERASHTASHDLSLASSNLFWDPEVVSGPHRPSVTLAFGSKSWRRSI